MTDTAGVGVGHLKRVETPTAAAMYLIIDTVLIAGIHQAVDTHLVCVITALIAGDTLMALINVIHLMGIGGLGEDSP